MEASEKKKRNNTRIIATNIFMGTAIVAIAGVFTLLAMGYSLTKDGGIEQSGLLQVKSEPSGATVTIDGNTQFSRTEMSKMLSGGIHNVLITKSGYDTWVSDAKIENGLLTRIDWIRLFPLEKTIETVKSYDSLRLVSSSPDSQYIFLLGQESAIGELIDIRSDETKTKNINLSTILGLPTGTVFPTGTLEITEWSNNNTKFILKWTRDEQVDWLLIDTQKFENSINLTKAFLVNFDDLRLSDDDAVKIWALESNNLRLIHTDDATISGALVAGVQKFANNEDVVAYVALDANQKRTVGIYKEGEKGSTTIKKIADDISIINIALGSHWRGDWVAFNLDEQLSVLSGKYPSFQSNIKLPSIFEKTLDYVPSAITVNPTGRIVIASSGSQIAAADIEIGDIYTYEFPTNKVNWLDNFLLWSDHENALTVIDFNGINQRKLSDIASGFDIALTSNNRWLYFFNTKITEIAGTTDEATGATSESTSKTTYLLQRERLNP